MRDVLYMELLRLTKLLRFGRGWGQAMEESSLRAFLAFSISLPKWSRWLSFISLSQLSRYWTSGSIESTPILLFSFKKEMRPMMSWLGCGGIISSGFASLYFALSVPLDFGSIFAMSPENRSMFSGSCRRRLAIKECRGALFSCSRARLPETAWAS